MIAETMPGDAEYLGAVNEIAEQNGRRLAQPHYVRRFDGRVIPTYSVGDFISWNEGDSVLSGYVIEVLDEDENIYHVAAHVPGSARKHYAVDGDNIRPF